MTAVADDGPGIVAANMRALAAKEQSFTMSSAAATTLLHAYDEALRLLAAYRQFAEDNLQALARLAEADPDNVVPCARADELMCGACGQPWTPDMQCGQRHNGHPFPTCYPTPHVPKREP